MRRYFPTITKVENQVITAVIFDHFGAKGLWINRIVVSFYEVKPKVAV
jgi:hypothetical protein